MEKKGFPSITSFNFPTVKEEENVTAAMQLLIAMVMIIQGEKGAGGESRKKVMHGYQRYYVANNDEDYMQRIQNAN